LFRVICKFINNKLEIVLSLYQKGESERDFYRKIKWYKSSSSSSFWKRRRTKVIIKYE